mmetsp:Transcript_22881/g.28121  ORF Transcript_22881/g.28121 Transcript_22881/m.28121 type:complete len:382 (-) Transcript_22881:70-1215(-)
MMQRLQQKLTKKTNKNFNEPNVPKLKRYELSQSNCTDIDEKEVCCDKDIPMLTKNDGSFFEGINENETFKPMNPKEFIYYKSGYKVGKKLATTLQGSIYIAANKMGHNIIVKRAAVDLYEHKVAQIDGHYYHVNEDIKKEANIMKYLQSMNPPKNNWVKYIDLLEDGKNIYLLMEYGGTNLFEYTKLMHKHIKDGLLSKKEWIKHVKILFKQICKYISWLHNNCKVTHSDISLENIVIKDVEVAEGKFIKHGYIKFIDFGLAQTFRNKNGNFTSTRYKIGKTKYKSPELYNSKPYNAKLNDCWGLAVSLFMLNFGSQPYRTPNDECSNYTMIMTGKLNNLLKDINKLAFVSKHIIGLLNKIFCDETKRYDINDILSSKYFN